MGEDKKPVLPMAKITILETRGESSLVEWIEDKIVRRGYVQNDSLDEGEAMLDVLEYALPVGPDPLKMNLHKLTKRLRLRDVWTQADFQKKSHAVIRSLLEAMEVK